MQVRIGELDIALPLGAYGELTRIDNRAAQAAVYPNVSGPVGKAPDAGQCRRGALPINTPGLALLGTALQGRASRLDRDYQLEPAYRAILEQIGRGRRRTAPK